MKNIWKYLTSEWTFLRRRNEPIAEDANNQENDSSHQSILSEPTDTSSSNIETIKKTSKASLKLRGVKRAYILSSEDYDEMEDNVCEKKIRKRANGPQEKVAVSSESTLDFFGRVCDTLLTASKDELKCYEKVSNEMYTSWICSANGEEQSKWCQLKPNEKLPFYWVTIDAKKVYESPIENFQRFVKMHCAHKIAKDDVDNDIKNLWLKLSKQQRMPFIIESFLFLCCQGSVDLNDDEAVKNAIQKLNEIQN